MALFVNVMKDKPIITRQLELAKGKRKRGGDRGREKKNVLKDRITYVIFVGGSHGVRNKL